MNDSLDKKIRHRNAVARAHSQASRGQTPRLMVKETPVYSGRWREILPIVLLNVVLTFLTAGIFRFWAKTRIRRYFVSRMSFLNDPLEYTGTGLELFIGFLIVLGILVPVFIVSGIVQGFVVEPATNPQSIAYYEIGYLLFFYFLYNIAVYRAQRYRLSRMNWRGIRGGQEGSALKYAGYGLIMGVLSLITAGLLYPLMRRVLVGYRINQASFGTERFSYQGNGLKLFAAWMAPWLALLALFGLFSYAVWSLGIHTLTRQSPPDQIGRAVTTAWESYGYVVLAGIVLFFFALAWYRTFETRHWMNSTTFDELTFTSKLNVFHIFLPYAAYYIIMGAIVGGWIYAIVEVGESLGNGRTFGTPEQLGLAFTIALFFALWLIAGLLQPIIVQNWLLNNLCATLTIQGSFSPDALFQNQQEIPRSGEGLADALDVDAF